MSFNDQWQVMYDCMINNLFIIKEIAIKFKKF